MRLTVDETKQETYPLEQCGVKGLAQGPNSCGDLIMATPAIFRYYCGIGWNTMGSNPPSHG